MQNSFDTFRKLILLWLFNVQYNSSTLIYVENVVIFTQPSSGAPCLPSISNSVTVASYHQNVFHLSSACTWRICNCGDVLVVKLPRIEHGGLSAFVVSGMACLTQHHQSSAELWLPKILLA